MKVVKIDFSIFFYIKKQLYRKIMALKVLPLYLHLNKFEVLFFIIIIIVELLFL